MRFPKGLGKKKSSESSSSRPVSGKYLETPTAPSEDQNLEDSYVRKCNVIRVIDGDTFCAVVDFGFKLTQEIVIRLIGVNTPEIHTKDKKEKKRGLEMKTYLEDWVKARTTADKFPFVMKSIERDAFGRYLALLVSNEGTCVNDELYQEFPFSK